MKLYLITFPFVLVTFSILFLHYAHISVYGIPTSEYSDFKITEVISGLTEPTSMVFIDQNNILVLEKSGNVRIVSNEVLQNTPVLTVNAVNKNERGLLGITANEEYVFLYFNTELQKTE